MAKTVVERAFLDTNVLLSATDEGRKEHALAIEALEAWPAAGTALYASGQVLREYLSVATRPIQQNGLGLTQSDALVNARALASRLHLLEENLRVVERWLTLLDEVACAGKQVHDANIVATMLAHGVLTLVTLNGGDFKRFAAHVNILTLG